MKKIYLGIIILFSLAGGVIAFYASANGPWGYSDPVEYISTANSLLHGQGLGYWEGSGIFTPIKLHPPFYSVAIAFFGLTGANLVAVARWLNLLSFAACIFIAGWVFWRYTRTPALGIAASALMLAFPPMLTAFSSAYSEPLFILMTMVGGLCLLAYLRDRKWLLFILSALLLGMVPFTRYAGIAMVACGALAVLFHEPGKFWRRLKKGLLFGAVGILPTVLWLVHVYSLSEHTLGGRSVVMDAPTLSARFQAFRGIFIDTIWLWIPFQQSHDMLRYIIRFAFLGGAALAVVALTFLAFRRLRRKGESTESLRVFTFFGSSAVFFLAVLAGTYLFTSPTIDIDNRMLLPFFVCTAMGLVAAFSLWQQAWLKGKLAAGQALAWLAVAVCLYWYYPQTIDKVKTYHKGEGLTAYHWNNSSLIQAVRSMPADQPVIANDWELMLLWTGRPIRGFWVTFPDTQSSPYGSDRTDPAQRLFCEQGAALVLLNDFTPQYTARLGETGTPQQEALFGNLQIYGSYADGTIFLCK